MITSMVQQMDLRREIWWTGKMLGFKAIHVYPSGAKTVEPSSTPPNPGKDYSPRVAGPDEEAAGLKASTQPKVKKRTESCEQPP
jgi:hypothetical protein